MENTSDLNQETIVQSILMKAMEELLLTDCILGIMDFMGQLKWMKSSSSTNALMRQKLK